MNVYGELIRAQLHNSSAAPSPAVDGLMYFDTDDNKPYLHDGSDWKEVLLDGNVSALNATYSPQTADYTVTDGDGVRTVGAAAPSTSFTFVDADVHTGNNTITEASHGLENGMVIHMRTTTALPAGLTPRRPYYVVEKDTNTFKVALTPGGSAVDITAAASGGTHTVYKGLVVTLPTAADNDDRILTISKTDSNANFVVIEGEGSETIDGAANIVLYSQYDQITVHCDGSNWFMIQKNIKNLYQQSVLAANVTTSTTFLPFLNLVSGKTYRVIGCFNYEAENASVMNVFMRHGGTKIKEKSLGFQSLDADFSATFDHIFVASAATLDFSTENMASNDAILGGSTNGDRSWATVIEMNDVAVTTHLA